MAQKVAKMSTHCDCSLITRASRHADMTRFCSTGNQTKLPDGMLEPTCGYLACLPHIVCKLISAILCFLSTFCPYPIMS